MDCTDTSQDEGVEARDVMVVSNTLCVPGAEASAVVIGSHHDSVSFQESKLEHRTRSCDYAPDARELGCRCHNCSCGVGVEVHKLRVENERLREQVSHLEGVICVQLSEQDQEIKRQSAEVKTLSQLNENLAQQLLLYQVAVAALTMNEGCNYYMK